ncbi:MULTISPECIES: ABC transporter substrate-binding protein [Janthinobacterium]|uniref:Transcriptional regulator n=1 Tax=Janthinobacterium svalbardensis TaxID=368607 RepID=A0A290WXA1_9BURK|nr:MULTISPECIES: ABC transporter substrate-binding protein [Janthinobacterium]MBH1981780.1 ABC transporter substrate-binding protein [Burkholderiales bacterium]ATD61529.1 transcriptional regulator [Janthinobacterium svalbardensis]MBH1994556.1 ABC transporter substrate-binding protein [Burkholderiales bacterium]MBH2070632.1 ABC transporter substrate-binding protein [Burkholderiales bacterium]MDN2696479.1 ABC transporter substrate-binding protein [Janthinobacterium sp. SUN073]
MKKVITATLLLSAACGAFAADKPLKSIGVSVGDLANPFFVAIGRGAEESAKKLGGPGVKVTTVSSKYDLNTQVDQIENFIANKTDIIILNAVDSKGIAPAIKKARNAGVVVIAVDVGAVGASATVMSDNTMAGDVSCAYLAKQIGGKGNVVILNGPPVTSVIDRVNGCKKTLAAFKDIKILSDNQNAGGSRDGGMTVMSNLLTAYPKIDAVFAINDPTGIGAELAIKQSKRTDVKLITAVDGAPDGQNALKNKAGLFAATSAQNPYRMATDAVQMGYDIMNGRTPKQTMVLLPTPAITKENVATYTGWVKN